jgi:hypothetical protein
LSKSASEVKIEYQEFMRLDQARFATIGCDNTRECNLVGHQGVITESLSQSDTSATRAFEYRRDVTDAEPASSHERGI